MTTATQITREQLVEEVISYAERTLFDVWKDDEHDAQIAYWREHRDEFPNTREATTIGWLLDDIDCHETCTCGGGCGFGQGTCGKDCFVCYSLGEWEGYASARQDVLYAEHQLSQAEAERDQWPGLPDMQAKVVNAQAKVDEATYQFNWVTTRF